MLWGVFEMDKPICEDCEVQMKTGDEIFECPVCGCWIGWDSYYEQKAFRLGRW